jgi:hypothetical protein
VKPPDIVKWTASIIGGCNLTILEFRVEHWTSRKFRLENEFFPLIHDPETFMNLLPRQSASAAILFELLLNPSWFLLLVVILLT